MSLAEYEELLADLVVREKITIEQAQELRQRFINGEFDDEDLPLPLEQAQEKDKTNWALWYFFAGSADREREQWRKNRRADLMQRFDIATAGISGDLTDGKYKLSKWHKESLFIVGASMFDTWKLGNGTNAEPNIDEQIDQQLNYLYRFAAEQHALSALGAPMSEAQTVNRLLLYGGAVWAAWFRGNESYSYDDGYIVQYVARDDRKTCQPCRQAQGYYRLNTGPYPGEICYGGGRCRCERRVIYAPEILAAL